MRTKKILIIINTITPYQLDFFDELNRRVKLNVIFHSKNYKNYNFNYKEKNYQFFLEQKKNPVKFIKILINNFQPDLILIGGYRLKYNSKIIPFLKKRNIKFFYWLENLNSKNYLKYKLVKYLIGKKIKSSNGVLAVGNNAKKIYSEYTKNVINFPYSIKVPKIKKKNFFHKKKINFLFVGQLIDRKGLGYIFSAFNKLSKKEKEKLSLNIVGEGNLIGKLKQFSKINTYTKYHGFLFGKNLSKIYKKSDVLLFPSKFDGWGVVPLEAMLNSLSLIISKTSGISEILKNKNNGFLIEPNETALYKALKKCLNNKSMIKKQGISNRRLVLNSVCNAKNATKFLLENLFNIK